MQKAKYKTLCLVCYHLWRKQKLGRRVYVGGEGLSVQSQIVFRRPRKLVFREGILVARVVVIGRLPFHCFGLARKFVRVFHNILWKNFLLTQYNFFSFKKKFIYFNWRPNITLLYVCVCAYTHIYGLYNFIYVCVCVYVYTYIYGLPW